MQRNWLSPKDLNIDLLSEMNPDIPIDIKLMAQCILLQDKMLIRHDISTVIAMVRGQQKALVPPLLLEISTLLYPEKCRLYKPNTNIFLCDQYDPEYETAVIRERLYTALYNDVVRCNDEWATIGIDLDIKDMPPISSILKTEQQTINCSLFKSKHAKQMKALLDYVRKNFKHIQEKWPEIEVTQQITMKQWDYIGHKLINIKQSQEVSKTLVKLLGTQ